MKRKCSDDYIYSLIGDVINGYEFNKICAGKKFYKFLHDDLMHFGFTYKVGLNIDTKPFKPYGSCLDGGLYFCEESQCHNHYTNYGSKVALIEIPSDAQVYVEYNKFKANKIRITKIYDFDDAPDDLWISITKKDSRAFERIKTQTENICKLAVQQDGYALYHVKKQFKTEEICSLAVKQNGFALKYVTNQTELICTLAVKQNCTALCFVNECFQTIDICTLAVKQDGMTLKYVNNQNQTAEICRLAVQQNAWAIQFVTDEFKTASSLSEICTLAVKQNGLTLEYVINQTDDICKLAVQNNGLALQYVINQTDEICKLAVQQEGLALQYVINQTEEIRRLADQQNNDALHTFRKREC